MSNVTRIIIVAVLGLAVCGVIILKQRTPTSPVAQNDVHTKALPLLLDLGAGKCIPCKMMAPILEELKKEYAGSLKVEVVDVEENPDIAEKYEVRIIPTQIFFDAAGKELFRHEGFYSKEDIITRWKELGVRLTKAK
ncbi:MAG TPA: thioredoxin [Planctomycetes bacterium]|nr:thioredoxin [Planctomycetota bacterium]